METSKRDNWRKTTFLASVAKDLMVRFGKDMPCLSLAWKGGPPIGGPKGCL